MIRAEIDDQLRFNQHIATMTSKAAMQLNARSRLQRFIEKAEKINCNNSFIWDKIFKNGPSEICGSQPLKNLKWSLYIFQRLSFTDFTRYIFEYCVLYMPILTAALWFGIFVHMSLLEKLKTFKNFATGLNWIITNVIIKL